MFENLCKIRISGRCFPQQAELDIFTKKSGNKARPRISLIFGRNGSGKTTLSNALREESLGRHLEGIHELQFLDDDGIQFNDMNKAFSQTRVFNEKFVDEKLRVDGDGIGSIVMLGDTGNIKDEMAEKTAQYKQVRDKIGALEAQSKRFEDSSDKLCPEHWRKEMIDALKGNAHWAFRKRQIDGGQRNASVNDSVLDRIVRLTKPDSDLSALTSEFQTKLIDYQSTDNGCGGKLPYCPDVPSWMSHFDENMVISLLRKPVEKPELTEREQRILSVIQSKGLAFVKDAQHDLAANQPELCPYCLRPITHQEIRNIGEEISAVLVDEVEAHEAELKNVLPANRQGLELGPFSESLRREVDSCENAFNKCLEVINQYEGLITQKEGDPFTPIDSEPLGFNLALDALRESLKTLRKGAAAWNEKIDQADKRKEELYTLSDDIARLEIDSLHTIYNQTVKDKADCFDNLEKAKHAEAGLERDLSTLSSQLNNTYIALSKINTLLAMIFGNRDRLRLEPIEDNEKAYRLVSRGVHVQPEDVSSGERNAIALCYFFTQIGEGKALGKEYSEEELLVIDDPVSSFDFENKIGILSVVKRFVRKVLQGNQKSRAILMTHDYITMKSLESACKDINYELRSQVRCQKSKELRHFSLIDWNDSEGSYGALLDKAYKHTINPTDETRDGLGNAARRMMEAFSTFEYGRPFDTLVSRDDSLGRVSDPFLRDYFHDFLFKLALHQESHLKDPVIDEGSIDVPDPFSSEGIDRSVRDALCLIYLLNKEHVLAHVSDPLAERQFENWIKGIKALNAGSLVPPH